MSVVWVTDQETPLTPLTDYCSKINRQLASGSPYRKQLSGIQLVVFSFCKHPLLLTIMHFSSKRGVRHSSEASGALHIFQPENVKTAKQNECVRIGPGCWYSLSYGEKPWHLSGIKGITSCTVPPGLAGSFVEDGFKGQSGCSLQTQTHQNTRAISHSS